MEFTKSKRSGKTPQPPSNAPIIPRAPSFERKRRPNRADKIHEGETDRNQHRTKVPSTEQDPIPPKISHEVEQAEAEEGPRAHHQRQSESKMAWDKGLEGLLSEERPSHPRGRESHMDEDPYSYQWPSRSARVTEEYANEIEDRHIYSKLSEILLVGHYFCSLDVDHYLLVKSNAYDLENHCQSEHDYFGVEWIASSHSSHAIALASVLQWSIDPNGSLIGRMERRENTREMVIKSKDAIMKTPDIEQAIDKMQEREQKQVYLERCKLVARLQSPSFPPSDLIYEQVINRIFDFKDYNVRKIFEGQQRRALRLNIEELFRDSEARPPKEPAIKSQSNISNLQLIRYPKPFPELLGSEGTAMRQNQGISGADQSSPGEEESGISVDKVDQENPRAYPPERDQENHWEQPPLASRNGNEQGPSLRQSNEESRGDGKQLVIMPRNSREEKLSQRRSTENSLSDREQSLVIYRTARLQIPAPEDRDASSTSQILRSNDSAAAKGMRTLLIYRAVLFAGLCDLAADTSCVFETELGRRVVQVL